jgi:hypothetical protein
MSDKVPETYRQQDGCWNCRHSDATWEWDEGVTLYCTEGAPPRPLCDSVAMSEQWRDGAAEYEEDRNAWEEWSKDREVARWGICDRYEKDAESKGM